MHLKTTFFLTYKFRISRFVGFGRTIFGPNAPGYGLVKWKFDYSENWIYSRKKMERKLRLNITVRGISIEDAKNIKSKIQHENYYFNIKFYLTCMKYSDNLRMISLPYLASIDDVSSGEKIAEFVSNNSEVRKLANKLLLSSDVNLPQYLQQELIRYWVLFAKYDE